MKSSSSSKFSNNGKISIIIMVKMGMIITCMMKYLKGKIKILLGGDDRDETFRVEILRPGFNRRSNSVGF